MAIEFAKTFKLNQEVKIKEIDPRISLYSYITWQNIDEKKWQYYVYEAFLNFKEKEQSVSDIVILLTDHKRGLQAVEMFSKKNIKVNHVFEDEYGSSSRHKKAFWMGDGRLKISTIHSFKGWEIYNVILFIPEKAPTIDEDLDTIIYTALTRTRESIIIINANERYKRFGEKFLQKNKK